jgi:DNA-binding transcriptional ArsR family regulator
LRVATGGRILPEEMPMASTARRRHNARSERTERSERALRALAEPNRRAILRLVRDGPRSVGEIRDHFQISQQAVSQHLQVLAEAGLVAAHAEGRRRLYVVDPDGLEAVDAFLAELWPAGLRRLKAAVEGKRRS